MAGYHRKIRHHLLLSFAICMFLFHSSNSYIPFRPRIFIRPFPENQLHLYNNNNNIAFSSNNGLSNIGLLNTNNNANIATNVNQIQDDESDTEFFDLSYTYDNDTIFYPGQRFDFEHYQDVGPTMNRTSIGNYPFSYASWSFCMAEHGGTHIDAPFHFNRFGWRLNEIPLKRLVDVPTCVIDVEHHVFARKNPDEFLLQVEHISEHETLHGPIRKGSLVLIRFGWARFWSDKLRYSGWNNDTLGQEPTLNFPGVSGQAVTWLLRERQIIGVGTDTMSTDIGNNGGTLPAHILLLEAQAYILENVANLDNLVLRIRSKQSYPNGCNLRSFVLPIKTRGTGGPTRLLAYCRTW